MSIYIVAPASDLALAVQTGLPHAAGEAARRMICEWAAVNGLELLQGYQDAKYPRVCWNTRGEPYHPAYLDGSHAIACLNPRCPGCPPGMNAITPVPPDAVILDCDSPGQCQIAHLPDIPPHFSTRGTGGCKHWFHNPGGLPRIIRAMGLPLDFLGNPFRAQLWVKAWGPGYEVLTHHHDAAVLPASLLKLHARAVVHEEEMRSRLGSVPVDQYLREGIEPGQQSYELWRSACSLAACGHNELETQGLLRQIADRSELTREPWYDSQLESMARRAAQFARQGGPSAPQQDMRSVRQRITAARQQGAGGQPEVSQAERETFGAMMAKAFGWLAIPEPGEVSAGQGIIGPLTPGAGEEAGERGVQKSVDLRQLPFLREQRTLRTVRQVERKEKAEHDRRHPRSLDWEFAPEGAMGLYERLCADGIKALQDGAPAARFRAGPDLKLNGPWREQLEWLLTGNGAALIGYAGGLIALLSDPESEKQSAYPGAPDDMMRGNPGRSWTTAEKDYWISVIRGCPEGAALTQRQLGTVLNGAGFRQAFGMQDRKYVSVKTISDTHVRLRKEGRLRVTCKAVHYRRHHQWRLDSPARYHSAVVPWPGSELEETLTALIGVVQKPEMDQEDLRQRLGAEVR